MIREEDKYFTEIKPFLEPIEKEVFTRNEYRVIPMVSQPARVIVFNQNGQLILVNSIGLQILNLCTGKNNISAIFEVLHKKYGESINSNSLLSDLIKFIRKASFHGLISRCS